MSLPISKKRRSEDLPAKVKKEPHETLDEHYEELE
jgi:hypothetical protein